jgi:hypothetical protein
VITLTTRLLASLLLVFSIFVRAAEPAEPEDVPLFTQAELDQMLAEFDLHPPTPDKKHLILVFVMVPWEHPAELRELYLLAVELSNDLGPPMFVDQRKFFSERLRCHGRSST